MITFQRYASSVLEKDITWAVKLVKDCEIMYLVFKVAAEELAIVIILK